jgi:DNA polymerase III subunit gamma/tau
MQNNFIEKYSPKYILDLPYKTEFVNTLKNFINIKHLYLLLINNDAYIKSTIIQCILNELKIPKEDILYLSNIKDPGITNLRYEIKQFCQTPSITREKKIIILDEINTYSETVQKIFVNYIDKFSKNLFFIATTTSLYSVDDILNTRLFPLNIPSIENIFIKNSCKKISEIENIKITPEAIDYITVISDNSIQFMFNILQKCKLLLRPITLDLIKELSTLIHFDNLKKYIILCKEHNLSEGYSYLLKFVENGYSVLDIMNELYFYVKITDILTEEQKYKIFIIICKYIEIIISIHEEEIELLLFTRNIINCLS